LLKLMGWKTVPVGPFPVEVRKYVMIVAPHTSGWDFIISVLYRSTLRLERARYLGKKELFRPPFGFIFRWLGGTPVDRSSSHNMVDEVVKMFNRKDEFAIALSPEGTRQKVDRLRTGFYNIAKNAGVPIIMVGLDFRNKQVHFSEPLVATDNQQADFEKIIDFFAPIDGKHPELGLSHLKKEDPTIR
jgi:1-acyl-sn-glycerol-3-phosphate acyltransferase